jgi:hypothetical protein
MRVSGRQLDDFRVEAPAWHLSFCWAGDKLPWVVAAWIAGLERKSR